MSPSESISPTAHYTGFVWARNGLSHPELETLEGRVLFESLRPVMAASSATQGIALEGYLLARHTAIDALLERAIERDGITQVVEVAAGLSPRGWRFVERHPELTYIETDLAGMAERKREALERMGSLDSRHRVQELDALADDGPGSLSELAAGLDRQRGLAIVTEGLLEYLDRDSIEAIWARFASALGSFRAGRYISNIHLGDVERSTLTDAFRVLLSVFVRGRVHVHFATAEEVENALAHAGFADAEVFAAKSLIDEPHRPGSHLAHILEASIR